MTLYLIANMINLKATAANANGFNSRVDRINVNELGHIAIKDGRVTAEKGLVPGADHILFDSVTELLKGKFTVKGLGESLIVLKDILNG